MRYLIANAHIVTGADTFVGSVGVDGGLIAGVWRKGEAWGGDHAGRDAKGIGNVARGGAGAWRGDEETGSSIAGRGEIEMGRACAGRRDEEAGSSSPARGGEEARIGGKGEIGTGNAARATGEGGGMSFEEFAASAEEIIDATGLCLLAGGIDAHVHFREPGMTHKGDIQSESRAALLGGITSYIDMPNTRPPTISEAALEEKLALAEGRSWADYGFHFGATNSNLEEILEADQEKYAGIKVFMGSSTGNMLVDKEEVLRRIFQIKGKTILIHSEDQGIIEANLAKARAAYGNAIPFSAHPAIRSRLACIKSTSKALELAIKYGTRLHICHVSTAEEVQMVRAAKLHNPLISAETSVNYLWFCDEDYSRLGSMIKCNPAIKSAADREALIAGLAEGVIDSIGSDHAPHTAFEKGLAGVRGNTAEEEGLAKMGSNTNGEEGHKSLEGSAKEAGLGYNDLSSGTPNYLSCPSGTVSVGEQLSVLFTIAAQTGMPLTRIASAISERPAEIFGIARKGFIRAGMEADLVLIDPSEQFIQGKPEYKCGWSPYEGEKLCGAVKAVFLHGEPVVKDGNLLGAPQGRRLKYANNLEEQGAECTNYPQSTALPAGDCVLHEGQGAGCTNYPQSTALPSGNCVTHEGQGAGCTNYLTGQKLNCPTKISGELGQNSTEEGR